MTLQAIDKAVLNKIKAVFTNTVFSDEDNLFTITQQTENKTSQEDIDAGKQPTNQFPGRVRLPIIGINRTSNQINLSEYGNDAMIRRGFHHNTGEDRETSILEFPINCTYQINIVGKKREDVDSIWGELCFYLYNDPEISVEIDGLNLIREIPVQLSDTNIPTNYALFDEQSQLHRQVLDIEIPEARLYMAKHSSLVTEIPITEYFWNGTDFEEMPNPDDIEEIEQYTVKASEEDNG